MYVSEISSPKWRGMLGVGSIVCLTLGINYMLAIGAVLPMYPGSWKVFAIACVAPQMMGNFATSRIYCIPKFFDIICNLR